MKTEYDFSVIITAISFAINTGLPKELEIPEVWEFKEKNFEFEKFQTT